MNFCGKGIYLYRQENSMNLGLKMFKLLPKLLWNVLKTKILAL